MAFKKLLTLVGLLSLTVKHVVALDPTDTITSAGDNDRSGHMSNHNMDPNVLKSGTFDQIWRTKGLGNYNGIQEEFYAQPLIFTPEGEKQSVYVVSQQNWVYRLDAVTGEILASRQLMIPFLTVPDLEGCNDIAGCVGSTATGVIDPARNAWYLTTKTYADQTKNTPQGLLNGRYFIHAIDVITLEDKPNFPVPLEGLAADNAPWRIFEGGKHHQRPALMQVNDYVYAGFASHCVQWNFTGWIIGWHAGEGRIVSKFALEGGTEANGKGAGVWMSGGGLASDNPGRMFFATGNGYASQLADDPVPGRQPPTALEEAVVNMAIAEDGSLTPTDFFIPWEKRDLDGMDKDLGTSGFILMEPDVFSTPTVQRIGCVAGKTGKLYFLNVDNLGGYQMGPNRKDDVLQTVQMAAPVFASAGTYPFEGGYVYVTPVGSETVAFKFGVGPDGQPVFTEAGKTAHKSAGRQGVGHSVITTMNGEPGTGILWIVDVDGNNLRAYGTVPVDGVLPTLALLNNPGQTKFSRPSFGNGKVYLTTQTGYITAFGSPVNMPLNCSSPYDVGSVQLNSSITTTITCKAVTPVQLDSVDLDSPASFSVSDLPTFPLSLNQDAEVSFKATFSPKAVGPLSTNINIRSTNLGGGKFAANTPVVIRGTGVSINPVLSVQPNVVSFGEVVTGDEAQSQSFSLRNGGQTAMIIQSYQWSVVGTSGPYITPDASIPFTFTNLPAIGGSVAAGSENIVGVSFNPTVDGYSQLYLVVQTNGGKANVGFFGTAGGPPRAVLEWQLTNGTWIEWKEDVPFDFDGGVQLATQRNQKMRLRNIGGTTLTTTISKPPVSGPLAAVNALGSIAEGSQIAPNKSEEAILVCSPPKGQVNMDPIELTAVWTLNNNDATWGKHEVRFRCMGLAPQVGPLDPEGQGYLRYHGCFKDADPERQLEQLLYSSPLNTNQKCMTECLERYPNYGWVATEYEAECWCGSKSARRKVPDTNCNYLCKGDYTQYCGGDGAYMSLFYDRRLVNPNDTISSSSSITVSSTSVSSSASGSTVSSGTASTTATLTATTVSNTVSSVSTSAIPSPTGPSEYEYLGCANEGTNGRALTKGFLFGADMTLNKCQTYCSSLGFALSGVEYSSECFCGDVLENGSTIGGSDQCNMPCSGAPGEICGGPSALSVWRWKAAPSASASITATASSTASSGASSATASASPTPTGPSDYEYLGCANEGTNGRALTKGFLFAADMTLNKCQTYCSSLGFALSGVEYSSECFCGDVLENASTIGGSDQCNMPCSGAPGEICGGPSALSVWRWKLAPSVTSSVTSAAPSSATSSINSSATVSPTPTGPSDYEYLGCANEGINGRALTKGFLAAADMTRSKCQTYCSGLGFPLSGVEYSTECYCGTALENGSTIGGATNCNMPCGGAPNEVCGGTSALSVFRKKSWTSSGTATATTSQVPSTTVSATPTPLPSGWTYLGCANEGIGGRALTKGFLQTTDMTIGKCLTYCSSQGFPLSGVEYSTECYCGDALENESTIGGSTSCSMPCGGAGGEICGGPGALSVFRNTAIPISVSSALPTTGTPTTPPVSASPSSTGAANIPGWKYLGCANEPAGGRALVDLYYNALMTNKMCTDYCASKGYSLAGTEYATECWCGNALATGSTVNGSTNCNVKCGGYAGEICGGGGALSLWGKDTTSSVSSAAASSTAPASSTIAAPAGVQALAAKAKSSGVASSSISTSASTKTSSSSAPSPTSTAYTSLGCAPEPASGQLLSSAFFSNDTTMTPLLCRQFCTTANYPLSGTENASECYCGITIPTATILNSTRCTMSCAGDEKRVCGGDRAVSILRWDDYVPPITVKELEVENASGAANSTWKWVGCYNEPTNGGKVLRYAETTSLDMTVEKCVKHCGDENFTYAGVEWETECWCGNELGVVETDSLDDEKCNSRCKGDVTTLCGAREKVGVYKLEA